MYVYKNYLLTRNNCINEPVAPLILSVDISATYIGCIVITKPVANPCRTRAIKIIQTSLANISTIYETIRNNALESKVHLRPIILARGPAI